jgi:tripartite-type tricarboxylate transporter receptor subunit TctC
MGGSEEVMDRRGFVISSLALATGVHAALAQSGPLTRIIFPFAAGGSGDLTCRLVAEHLAPLLGRHIIVENRTGGDGLIAIKSVMNAPPDGATILITTGPTMYLLPMVEAKPSFDQTKDFVPVSLLGRFEFAVVTGPGTNAADFSQLVTWLKANTAKAAYGIPSNGTIPHFAGTRIEAALNLPMTRVPYRGGAAVVKDVIGGHLPFAVITVSDALPSHQAGSVRILAVSSEKRSRYLPDVPTLKESGIDLVADSWYGMWLPAGASSDFVRQLSAAAMTVLAKPEVKEKLLAIGLIPVGTTPEGLAQELAANTAFWRPIVQATGYKITN